MTEAGGRSKKYFARVAGRWDDLRAEYFTEEMRDDAIARVKLPAGAVVADVGTGTGFVARALAPKAGRVIGIDESPEMLDVARKNLRGFANVEFVEAPGQRIPLPDGSLDAVFANMYLHHAPHPSSAIAELARLLKPGGTLAVIDADEHDQAWMREAMADRWLGFKRSDVRAWFEEAGLADVAVDCAKGRCCPRTEGGRRLALGIFVALGTKPREAKENFNERRKSLGS